MTKKVCFYCNSTKNLIFDEFGMIYICKGCELNDEIEFSNRFNK